ncbi:MAG: TonB-dependent receptor plug domain-containing protein, partial [Longimicrobiales bacterium]
FELIVHHEPGIRFRATRAGYLDNTTPFLYFDRHSYFGIEIRLDPEVVLLAPLEVVARLPAIRSPVLSGFEHRLATGMGWYLTREDFERFRPTYVTDLLARAPGVRIESNGRGNRPTVRMTQGAVPGRDCPVQIFVDGMLLNPRTALPGRGESFSIDDVVSPASVEGVEVYGGLSTVPPEFLNPEAHCGVVAIWTLRGDRESGRD